MKPSWNVWCADYALRPSRSLLGLMVALHALAAWAACLAYIPWWARLAVLLAVGLAFALFFRRWRRPGKSQLLALRERGADWWLQTGVGDECRASLLPDVLVWRYLLVLRFRELGAARPRHFSVPILPDSLPPQGFRRLYVRMRLRKLPAEAAAEEGV